MRGILGASAGWCAHAHALGAGGVPFFVLDGRYAISGAQRSELFTQALDRAWAEGPGRPLAAGVHDGSTSG